MSLLVPPRRPSDEILDDPGIPADDMCRSLQDLALVNRWWGSARALARFLLGEIRRGKVDRPVILDVGAGSGDVSRGLARSLARAGHPAFVVACDVQWRHLAAGRSLSRDAFPSVAADAFALPFREGSVDWIVATLFVHHFSPEQNARLLLSFARTARRGFALLDLTRNRVPLAFISVAGRLFKTPISLRDGIASVRQAYTPDEARRFGREAVPGARVDRIFPFRYLLSATRS